MVKFIRSFIFDSIFYVFTTIYLLLFFIPMLILPRGFTVYIFRTWTRMVMFALRYIVGLSYTVEGLDILEAALKNGPCILALKHQSACETIFCSLLAQKMSIVLKKQLLYIPIYGIYLKKLNSIVIDRDNTAASLKKLLMDAKKNVQNGHSILIFPEGTRQNPGESGEYKGGVGLLYKTLQIPVIPIALNTGLFWGRRSFIKKPGKIIFKILEPIPAGLDRDRFLEILKSNIESESSALCYQTDIESVTELKKKVQS